MSVRAVEVAKMILDSRETARMLAGDGYAGRVAEWKTLVVAMASTGGITLIESLMELLREAKAKDLEAATAMWLCAATAELIDDEAKAGLEAKL